MTVNSSVKKSVFSRATVILLVCFFAVSVILPLSTMLVNLGKADFISLVSDRSILKAAVNSLVVSAAATVISIALGGIAAWCMTRTGVRLKGLFNILILLPMLIPSISHGMGLIILFGSNGILTRLFGLSCGIYGFTGIVAGSVMYSFPVAYIMISDILKYEDRAPYDAAEVLGIPRQRRFSSITLPYLRKPLVSVIFAVFTMIVTDYGVPLMIGGMYKTLPVLMYEEVIGRQDFVRGSFFGLILLIPAVAAFIFDLLCKNDRSTGGMGHTFVPVKKKGRDTAAFVILSVISVCVVFPIAAFIAMTFAKRYPSDMSFTLHNIESALRKGAGEYLLNSVAVAFSASLIGTAIAFICACFTSRGKTVGVRILHLMSVLPLAIPGVVLGLSYVLFFNGSIIYGTLAILVLANTIHFFSSPYLMICNSIGKLDPDLEAAAASLGIGKFRLIIDVILPQTRTTLAEMFSYFFVNSMMTISAVAFLANIKTKPVSLMIPQFEAQMLLEASAFVSLLILAVNLIMKGAVQLLRFHKRKRKDA